MVGTEFGSIDWLNNTFSQYVSQKEYRLTSFTMALSPKVPVLGEKQEKTHKF